MPAIVTDRLDGLSTSVAVKAPCRVATVSNLVALAGLQTVNGVVLADGDRVLVKDQTDATQNGIWTAHATAWTRARDFDGARDAVQGTIVWVQAGTVNPGTFWRLTTADPVRIGASSLSFSALDVFASLLPDALTALDYPRVAADGSGYELRSPAQVLSDIGAQPLDADLTAIAGSATTEFGRSVLTQADAAALRTLAALGTLAMQDASSVGITGGSISGAAVTLASDPDSAMKAATKQYVDGVAVGLGKRGRVRAATTANVTLSGTRTVDGVALSVGDLILVKDQTAQAANGLYTVASGAWPRDANYDSWAELEGCLIAVEEGSTQGDTLWLCTSNGGGTLDTTAATFSQIFPGSGGTVTNLTASNGVKTTSGMAITSTGNFELDVSGLTAGAAPALSDPLPYYLTASAAHRKVTFQQAFDLIASLTASTAAALTDAIPIYDGSGTAAKKITFDNLMKLISGLTEDTSPDTANDFVITYDASALGVKKVKPQNLSSVPAGAVMPYAGASAPTGWLFCDGSAVSRSTYSALFSAIGTTYGTGDGSTTFGLPDLRGRAPFGKDNMNGTTAQNRVTSGVSGITGTTLGAVGGDERMQSHSHSYSKGTGGAGGGSNSFDATQADSEAPTGATGSGNSQNMPPAIILNYVIKT